MRLLFGLVLVLGVGLAGFAVYMAQDRIGQYQSALAQQRAEARKNVPLEEIYVTTRALSYGEELKEEDVQLVLFPKPSVPEGAFRTKEELFPANTDRPRFVLRRVEEKEALLAVKVTTPGEDAGVSSRLAKGMRAFAIKVDVSTGVSGFLRPGDKVDVYWSGGGEGAGGLTKLIEAGIKLIAIDQIADTERTSATIARTVTVEVSPQQVASLAQAQATGRLSLSLVGATDDTVATATDVNQHTLLGIVEKEVVQAAPEQTCSIRTRKGAEVVEIPIPCQN
ncbi:MAG: Flp pilus assembly protein CpaB [Brevirhabdus sp.]